MQVDRDSASIETSVALIHVTAMNEKPSAPSTLPASYDSKVEVDSVLCDY